MMWQTRFGHCIYTSASGYKVYQNPFYRWLTLGSSALQTMIMRNKPESPILYYLQALTLMAHLVPGDSCLLGLGGGGVAHILHAQKPMHPILAIDNSLEVIGIAKEYFMTDMLTNLSILHEDAKTFVTHSHEQFIHIMVDLYNAHHFPEECAHDEFFIQCKNRLKPNGFLSINLANKVSMSTLFKRKTTNFEHNI